MIRHPVTPEGHRALQRELKNIKEVVRPGIVRDIEEARAQGDISENSEYEDAKERQAHCEGRLAFVESVLAAAEVIDVTRLPRDGRAVFGTTVVLADPDTGDERTWRIVGETEADVDHGLISFKSPLGKAMIGQPVGAEIAVPTPQGIRRWEIIDVQYTAPDA